MNRDRRAIRRKSMLGTVLFALGIIAAVVAVITGSAWIIAIAAICLVSGILLLYQVGHAIS